MLVNSHPTMITSWGQKGTWESENPITNCVRLKGSWVNLFLFGLLLGSSGGTISSPYFRPGELDLSQASLLQSTPEVLVARSEKLTHLQGHDKPFSPFPAQGWRLCAHQLEKCVPPAPPADTGCSCKTWKGPQAPSSLAIVPQ